MLAVCRGAGELVLLCAAENETGGRVQETLVLISRKTKDLLRRVMLCCVDVTSDCHVAENIQLNLQFIKPERAVDRFCVFLMSAIKHCI